MPISNIETYCQGDVNNEVSNPSNTEFFCSFLSATRSHASLTSSSITKECRRLTTIGILLVLLPARVPGRIVSPPGTPLSMLFAVVTLALAALASAATNCSLTVSVVHGPLAVCLMRHNIDGHQLWLSGFGWCWVRCMVSHHFLTIQASPSKSASSPAAATSPRARRARSHGTTGLCCMLGLDNVV